MGEVCAKSTLNAGRYCLTVHIKLTYPSIIMDYYRLDIKSVLFSMVCSNLQSLRFA